MVDLQLFQLGHDCLELAENHTDQSSWVELNNNNNDCIWYSDPESDSQRELKATYFVRCRPTWEINLYLTPGPGVEPGSSALKASVLPLGHRSCII